MSLIVVINGEELDMNGADGGVDNAIALTFQINDFNELKDRQANFSNQFKVPKTDNNNRILGNTNILNSTSNIPYISNEIKIIDKSSGIELISGGVLYVDSVDTDYSLTIYAGNKSFFSAIDNKNIQDFNYGTRTWERTGLNSMLRLATNNTFDQLAYFSDDGTVSTSVREIEADKVFYSMYLRRIWKDIHADAGFTFNEDHEIFQSDIFNSLFFPFTNSEIVTNNNPFKPFQFKGEQKNFSDNINVLNQYNPREEERFIEYNNTADPSAMWNNPLRELTIKKTGNVSFYGAGTIKLLGIGNDSWNIEIRIYKNGSIENSYTFKPYEYTTIGGVIYLNTGAWNIDMDVFVNDVIKISYFVEWGVGNNLGNVHFQLFQTSPISGIKSFIGVKTNGEDPFNNDWDFAKNLPDFTHTDVVKMVANLYCLIPITDFNRNNIRWIPFEDIVKNKAIAKDWSDYVVDDLNYVSINFHSKFAQKNNLKYKSDKWVTDKYGDGEINVNDITLEKEKDQFEFPVAATLANYKLNQLRIPEILRFERDNNTVAVTSEPRLLVRNLVVLPSGDPIKLKEPGSVLFNNSINYSYGYFNRLDFTLQFSGSYLGGYYQGITNVLKDYRQIKIKMLIPPSEIINLDQTIPIFLKQYSQYFYVNKVSEWKPDNVCNVELIKI
jgi:hypothetical protein